MKMSPRVALLVLTLLGYASAQNNTNGYTLKDGENLTDIRPHNDILQTTTGSPTHQQDTQPKQSTENRKIWPPLKFNPPDFIPFPKEGNVAQFWEDHPGLRAIPDLPAKDTEYPKWLLRVMGRIPTTTPASAPIENDQVPLSSRPVEETEVKPDGRPSDDEDGDMNAETLTKENDLQDRFEDDNIPVQRETKNTGFPLPPEIPLQKPILNYGMQNLLPVPNNIPRYSERKVISNFPQNHDHPVLFRIPLNFGFGRIQHIKMNNRNPSNLGYVRNNIPERHPSSIESMQMVPLQRRNFRGIPVTISRPSVVHQQGILMLPMRNQNSRLGFIQPHPPRNFPTNLNRPQVPSFLRQNMIPVDPRFSRDPLPIVQNTEDNSERITKPILDRKQEPRKQVRTWQDTLSESNGPPSLPRRSGFRSRKKRQSNFESFDPFSMGNMFSFFPSEKEPQNTFNWFPRESMVNSPTRQSPVNSGGFVPTVIAQPPRQQINVPKDAWRFQPSSSNRMAPNFQNQNPQTNHRSNTNEIPEDFLIIKPNRGSSQNGHSNRMPWILSNMFGGDLFADNGENQMWTLQRPFDHQSNPRNIQRPPTVNHGQLPNNDQGKPFQRERMPPPNIQPPYFQPPVYQPTNFNPNRGQGHDSRADDIQRPPNRLPPPMNRNDINRGPIQEESHKTHARPHVPPQENWRPDTQKPPRPQMPVAPRGTWIPKESTHKNAPVSSNHFHEVPRPHHQEPHHHHNHHQQQQRPAESVSRPTEVPVYHEDTHRSHRTQILPDIQKGKRKLTPSEVRHLLSLLPEFPKEVYKKPRYNQPKSHVVGITINTKGTKRQKRNLNKPLSTKNDDGNFTRNYPGSNHHDFFNDSNISKLPTNYPRTLQAVNQRKKRDIKESLLQDVVFGSYGYHSEHGYQDSSFTDFADPFFGFMPDEKHDSDIHAGWGSVLPRSNQDFFNGAWDWPNHDYYRPHNGFGHFLLGHGPGHFHSVFPLNNLLHGNRQPINPTHLVGGRQVVVIPPAVPRANPNQLSYTARFRYRFGIYPGYSDFIPSTDDHEIFFFYDAEQKDQRPDAVIPFRFY